MNINWTTAWLAVALATGCATSRGETRITPGVYREPAKVEAVAIRGDVIEFRIRVAKLDPEKIFERMYSYTVATDGVIRVIASSNDSVFVFGVLNYGWSWDGKNIVRKDPKSGEAVIFALEATAQK
jgi:hypothetical protein